MSSSNSCFLTCIQISKEADQVVWCSLLFKNFTQFIVIHTVKGFGIINQTEVDVFFSGILLLFPWPYNSVQSLSHVRLFVTPWTAAHQATLSITSSRDLLKFMFIESMTPSNHLILCQSLLLPPSIFPALGYFPVSQLLASGGQSIWVSASASIRLMNIQDWVLLGLTGLICLQSKGLSRVFPNTTVQKHHLFDAQLSL